MCCVHQADAIIAVRKKFNDSKDILKVSKDILKVPKLKNGMIQKFCLHNLKNIPLSVEKIKKILLKNSNIKVSF